MSSKKIYILQRVYDNDIYSPMFFNTFADAQNELIECFGHMLYEENKLLEFQSKFGDIHNVNFESVDENNMYPSFEDEYDDYEIGHGYFYINNCGPTNGCYVGKIDEVYISILDEIKDKIVDILS